MKKNTAIWSVVVLIFIALVTWLIVTPGKGGQLDEFATCLGQKGVKFYGAFWCPHCQAQKALFGKSVSKLPYIECSNPDGQTQDQVCNDAKIEGYPTWEFADGSRVSGEQSLQTLADKSSCVLPK